MQNHTKTQRIILLIGFLIFVSFFLIPKIHAQSDFEINYSKGIKSHEEGNLPEAATELSQALNLNPQSLEANYALGVINQEENKHVEALKYFNVIYKTNKSYKNLSYRVALSYYNLNKDKYAEQFFKLEIEKGSDDKIKSECRYYLGKLYEKAGKNDLAKEEFDKAKGSVVQTKAIVKGKRWFLDIYPGFQFDTNVALISKGVALPPDISGKKAPRLFFSLNGSVIPVLNEDLTVYLSYLYYHGFNLMNNLDNFNICYNKFSFDSVMNHKSEEGIDTVKFMLGYDYQLSLISNSFDFFSQSHSIKPKFRFLFGENYTLEVRSRVRYDDFYTSSIAADNRDAFNFSGGFEDSLKFNEKRSKVYLGFDYERNIAAGINFNYYGLIPSAGLETPLWLIDRINLDFLFAFRRFVNFTPNPPHREDNTFSVELNLNKKLSNKIDTNINYALIINESIAGYSYNRHIISLIFGILL